MLEEDCLSLRKFVDFREENMSTCSDEIIKQILSVCSEFDGLCKEITGIKKVKIEGGNRERNANIADFGRWFSSKESKIDLNAISIILKNKISNLSRLRIGVKRQSTLWPGGILII